MPSIGHLTRVKRAQLSLDLGDGDVLNVVYDSNGITPAWVNQTQEPDIMAISRALSEALIEWDVTADEQGTPYPPTLENISRLTYGVLVELAKQIMEASVPSEEEKKGSSLPSSVTSELPESSKTLSPDSPNGSETSPQPSAAESLSTS